MGPVAPRHVGSSQTRARTRVPCISRQILNHCTTREAQPLFLKSQLQDLWQEGPGKPQLRPKFWEGQQNDQNKATPTGKRNGIGQPWCWGDPGWASVGSTGSAAPKWILLIPPGAGLQEGRGPMHGMKEVCLREIRQNTWASWGYKSFHLKPSPPALDADCPWLHQHRNFWLDIAKLPSSKSSPTCTLTKNVSVF